MKKIVGDILKNRNIDESLKEYYGGFMAINNKYASIRLAMNYYTYYTMMAEDDGILQSENVSGIELVNQIIENAVNDNEESLKADINKLEELRNVIIEKVQDLTCYVDRFNIYEYALNRVEYRFKEQDYPEGYSDENFTRKLMQYILADEDNMAVNRKISMVLGQLPMRFTKNKFYEMVSNGLSIYNGGTKESFNDFIYMIKTSSMLEKTDTMSANYPYLDEILKGVNEISFKTISSEQYEEIADDILRVSEYINEQMSSCIMLQEIINDLVIVLYTVKQQMNDNVVKACMEIIKDTNLLFLGKFSPKSTEEIEDMFVMLEGEQEELYPKLSTYDITDNISKNHTEKIKELGLEEEHRIACKLPKLNEDSLFVELNKVPDESIADEKFIENEEAKLFDEFAKVFANNDKMVNRAVMATAIAELPVFFNNISELQDFIFNTLSICNDKAEKLACIEILNGIMEE